MYMNHFNTLEQNSVKWDDFKKICTMRHSILPNNLEIVSKNAWINSLKEKLEDMQEIWSFDEAVQHFNEKGRQHCKKGKRGISGINGKKGQGNKSKKGRGAPTEDNDTDLGPNASAQKQKDRGFKNSGEPTINIIKGVDISPILELKGQIALPLFKKLPRLVQTYLHRNQVKQLNRNQRPTYDSKKSKDKAIKKLKKKIASIKSVPVDDDDSSSNEESDGDHVATNTTGNSKRK